MKYNSVLCNDIESYTYFADWKDAEKLVRPLCSFTVPEFEGSSYRITSLSYSPDGQDVLVSYSSDHLYLFSIKVTC